MHTHIQMYVHAHLYTDGKSLQRRLNASSNIIDAHTYPHTYACIYIYICTYTRVHTLQRVCHRCVRWCQNTLLYNVYTYACTGAQSTYSKVHSTLTAKKIHIYIHTHICIRMHMHTNTPAHPWHRPTRWSTASETHNLCTNMHTLTYTHVYTCTRIHICIHMNIYTYIHVLTHTYIHIKTHTHTTCTYACKHAWDGGAAATAQEAWLDASPDMFGRIS